MESETTNNTTSYLMQLKSLEGLYKQKLTEYESAYTTYINTLQSQNANSYVVLPGQQYMGTGSISDINNSTASSCEAACSANLSCSGASFNSINSICRLRTGDGLLIPGGTSDNAIITNNKQQLINLETLNIQLLEINKSIQSIYSQMEPSANTQTATLNTNNQALAQQYGKLMIEKEKINRLLDEYNDVNSANENQTLVVNQESSSYYFWMIMCILFIVLILNLIFFPEAKGVITRLLFIIFAVYIVLVIFNFIRNFS